MNAILFAFFITVFSLSLFYYWFALANRYLIFLYFHLGSTPFDVGTSSRYWMAGLVAMGLVMILYTAVNWFLARLASWRGRTYLPAPWWQVWLWCSLPLAIGILLIIMGLNTPTLPPGLAFAVVAVTLSGLALALSPGSLAATRPSALIWLAGDGAALLFMFTLFSALETSLVKPEVVPLPLGILIACLSLLFAFFWLGVMTALRRWRGKATPAALAVYAAGLCLSYLLIPVLHYLFRGYITVSANFFALSVGMQLLIWGMTAVIVFLVTKLRFRLLT